MDLGRGRVDPGRRRWSPKVCENVALLPVAAIPCYMATPCSATPSKLTSICATILAAVLPQSHGFEVVLDIKGFGHELLEGEVQVGAQKFSCLCALQGSQVEVLYIELAGNPQCCCSLHAEFQVEVREGCGPLTHALQLPHVAGGLPLEVVYELCFELLIAQ